VSGLACWGSTCRGFEGIVASVTCARFLDGGRVGKVGRELTVGGNGSGPICDYGRGAAGTARFVHELPGEDCGGGFITVYDECDPGFV